MNELTKAARQMHKLRADLAEHEATTQRRTDEIRREIRANALILENATDGLDAQKIAIAQSVLRVFGLYEKGGTDRASVISDAVKQISTGEPVREIYGDLWRVSFGTKNYAHWSGQRSDHEYGYGPKHGSTVFSVGFTNAVRKRDPKVLSAEETEAAIYYLTNIERVQQSAARASAAA